MVVCGRQSTSLLVDSHSPVEDHASDKPFIEVRVRVLSAIVLGPFVLLTIEDCRSSSKVVCRVFVTH